MIGDQSCKDFLKEILSKVSLGEYEITNIRSYFENFEHQDQNDFHCFDIHVIKILDKKELDAGVQSPPKSDYQNKKIEFILDYVNNQNYFVKSVRLEWPMFGTPYYDFHIYKKNTNNNVNDKDIIPRSY
jgi:hypothetical protein